MTNDHQKGISSSPPEAPPESRSRAEFWLEFYKFTVKYTHKFLYPIIIIIFIIVFKPQIEDLLARDFELEYRDIKLKAENKFENAKFKVTQRAVKVAGKHKTNPTVREILPNLRKIAANSSSKVLKRDVGSDGQDYKRPGNVELLRRWLDDEGIGRNNISRFLDDDEYADKRAKAIKELDLRH